MKTWTENIWSKTELEFVNDLKKGSFPNLCFFRWDFDFFSPVVLIKMARSNQPAVWPKGKKYDLDSQPNPAEQRIKLIMSAGLALVHAYSRLCSQAQDETELQNALRSDQARQIIPGMPLWEFYLREYAFFRNWEWYLTVHQLFNQSINVAKTQSINHPTNRSINQSINRPISNY